jgi:hypothetical protein
MRFLARKGPDPSDTPVAGQGRIELPSAVLESALRPSLRPIGAPRRESNSPRSVDSGAASPDAYAGMSCPREESNLGDRFRKSTPRSARRGRCDVRVMLPSETDSQTAGFASSLTPRCLRLESNQRLSGFNRALEPFELPRRTRYENRTRLVCLKGRRPHQKSKRALVARVVPSRWFMRPKRKARAEPATGVAPACSSLRMRRPSPRASPA